MTCSPSLTKWSCHCFFHYNSLQNPPTKNTRTYKKTSNIPKQNSKLRSFKAQTLIFMLAVQPSLLSFNATAFILPALCIMVLEARHQERHSFKEPLQTKLLYEHVYGGRKKVSACCEVHRLHSDPLINLTAISASVTQLCHKSSWECAGSHQWHNADRLSSVSWSFFIFVCAC